MGETLRPHCPACRGAETIQLGKLPDSNLFAGAFIDRILAGGYLYRCARCALKFRHPIDNAAAHEALYDNQDTLAWPTGQERADWEFVSEYVTGRLAKGRILDFGCYTGGLLARLGDAYERYGVEINRAAAAIASQVTGRPTFSTIDDIPEQSQFDVIVACDVVEHLANPREFIGRLGSLLSDQGILILTTGDGENPLWNRFGANWWYCYYPEHIAFISEDWLERNAETLGLTLKYCDTFRYKNLNPVTRPIHIALTFFYGWFPDAYLRLRKIIATLRGKPGITSVTGVGVSHDHLIAVLSPSHEE